MTKKSLKMGTLNYKKKDISNGLIKEIKRYQKHLQMKENVKYGRKAKYISFVFATKNSKNLARFITGDLK